MKLVKTPRQWYRLGREVKPAAIPLKFAAPQVRATRYSDRDEHLLQVEDDNRMFAEFQTTLYTPPPVEVGLVPKNKFGNLDVYVPSMVPAGGVHIPYKTATAVRAARLLAIDFAEAVVRLIGIILSIRC